MYDDWLRLVKKRWISASGLLVMIILSHGARAAASLRTFRSTERLFPLPHSSSASMTKTRACFGRLWMKSRKRVLHRLGCQIWVGAKTVCDNAPKRGEDPGECVDESRKDVLGLTQIRVIPLAEKRSSE